MKQSLLVTGATGFVGSRLCEAATSRGFEVRRAVRKPVAGDAVVVGEIGASTEWAQALEGVDVVVHLAARVHVMHETAADPMQAFREVNVRGTERLARQAAERGVRRMVFVSSIKVNGERTGARAFSEQDPPRPEDPYGISKAEAEQVFWRVCGETGMEGVVVRPPLVYGAGVGGNFERLMGLVARGLPLPLAAVSNRRSLVGRDNLVDLILAAAQRPEAAGNTFLAADAEDLSTAELIRRIAAAMGKGARLWPVPIELLRLAGRLTGKAAEVERLCGNLQVDNSHARKLLGWQPPVSVDEELQRTVEAWLRENGRRA